MGQREVLLHWEMGPLGFFAIHLTGKTTTSVSTTVLSPLPKLKLSTTGHQGLWGIGRWMKIPGQLRTIRVVIATTAHSPVCLLLHGHKANSAQPLIFKKLATF